MTELNKIPKFRLENITFLPAGISNVIKEIISELSPQNNQLQPALAGMKDNFCICHNDCKSDCGSDQGPCPNDCFKDCNCDSYAPPCNCQYDCSCDSY
jgi:hypothetical protein